VAATADGGGDDSSAAAAVPREASRAGAKFAAQAAAAAALASLALPPPHRQTFDEAERLEALRDLPPGLWDAHEFVRGAYGVGGTGGADGQVFNACSLGGVDLWSTHLWVLEDNASC
jgi:hypothetical protein